MLMPMQGSGAAQARVDAAQAKVQAAQAQVDAAQQQLQQQIQQTVEQAIRQAEKAGGTPGMSDDAKQNLKEEIRAAIDAAREASAENGSGPRIVFSDGGPHGGGTISLPNGTDGIIPPQVPQMMSILGITLVCCVVGLPIARAFGRWLDRRGNAQPVNQEVTSRLAAIEQAVESVAVEVERISEGQRFTARVLSERTHEATPDFAANRERVPAEIAGNAPVNARRG